MIKNSDGEKCSAKELAQEIMIESLTHIGFWREYSEERIEDMTDREVTLLNDQLQKLFKRACKAMGIHPDQVMERSNDPHRED